MRQGVIGAGFECGEAIVKTGWGEDRIVVETNRGRGRLRETFAFDANHRLIATVKMDTPRGAFRFRKVYDAGEVPAER